MKLLVVLVVILLLFLTNLFIPGFYQSHDGEIHLARFAAYYKSFLDGQLLPRWAADLNYGYGSPLFIFFYPLPGYLGSLLHFIGFSFENSFKILMIFAFVLAPISLYAFVVKFFPKEIAFSSALLYGLLPYHFLNLYVRGDIGEMLGLIFIPLVFLFIYKMVEKPNFSALLLGSFSYALLMLSHNGLTLMFTPIFLIYAFFYKGDKRSFLLSLSVLGLGLLLTTFFWLPALYESRYINKGLFTNTFKEHFPTLNQLIYSPWGFGTDVGKPGGLSPQIGPLHVLVVVLAHALFRKIQTKNNFLFWLFSFWIGVFFSSSVSSSLWERIGLLQNFQFPWRFTALSGLSSVMIASFVLYTVKVKKFLFAIMFLLIIASFPLTRVNGFTTREESYYFSFNGTPYHHGEATTIWTAGDPGEIPKYPIEVIQGKGDVKNVKRKSNAHTFVVNADTTVKILDNTIYFPGWQVFVDGKKVPIEFQDMNYRGLITFAVPQGINKVEVIFGESPIRLFADGVSLAALLLVAGVIAIRKKIKSKSLSI